MKRFNFFIIITIILLNTILVKAQNLSLGSPFNFLPNARTDKAIDITNFKGHYFVSWKETGPAGNIHICYIGKQYDTKFSQSDAVVAAEKSAFAPVFRVTDKHIYAFWLDNNGVLKYIINDSDTSFNMQNIHAINFTGAPKLTSGITATTVAGQIMIASHADNKDDMVVGLLSIDDKGMLHAADLQTVPGKKSNEYPFVVTIADNLIRLCYKNANDKGIYYTDFNIDNKVWTNPIAVCNSKSNTSPAIYHVFNTNRLFYIWNGYKKDNRVYYATENIQNPPVKPSILPDYFSTPYPVSICNVDDKKFIVVFVGGDQKLYLSFFSNYDPANWMGDTLFPVKGNLTLKDIVIPGSHDAGMSALNGTGGTNANSINTCNTLTQTQNIGRQLNAGIRMLDLRVGIFKNAIYSKHSSSDCMAEAIGGGYGEPLKDILDSVKTFLDHHKKEIVLITFSHFCPSELSPGHLADTIYSVLGKERIFNNLSKSIDKIKLNDLAGKAIITFEKYASVNNLVDSSSMTDRSAAFLNLRRAYAATNKIDLLLTKETQFFNSMKDGVSNNDLVRLDWQLTQNSDEAALVCNDFQDEHINPAINGMMLLTNVIIKNKSITDLALSGNKYLPSKIKEWINNGTINKKNKPNILYVDVAGAWITDYCIELNRDQLYN